MGKIIFLPILFFLKSRICKFLDAFLDVVVVILVMKDVPQGIGQLLLLCDAHILGLGQVHLTEVGFDAHLEMDVLDAGITPNDHVALDILDDFSHECRGDIASLNQFIDWLKITLKCNPFAEILNVFLSGLCVEITEGDNATNPLTPQECGFNEIDVVGCEQRNDIHVLRVTTIQGVQNVLKSSIPLTPCDLVDVLNEHNDAVPVVVKHLRHPESLGQQFGGFQIDERPIISDCLLCQLECEECLSRAIWTFQNASEFEGNSVGQTLLRMHDTSLQWAEGVIRFIGKYHQFLIDVGQVHDLRLTTFVLFIDFEGLILVYGIRVQKFVGPSDYLVNQLVELELAHPPYMENLVVVVVSDIDVSILTHVRKLNRPIRNFLAYTIR